MQGPLAVERGWWLEDLVGEHCAGGHGSSGRIGAITGTKSDGRGDLLGVVGDCVERMDGAGSVTGAEQAVRHIESGDGL